MATLHYMIALVGLLVVGVTSQQYTSNSNFVDEGNYDYAEAPPPRAAPRPAPLTRSQSPQSFSRPNSFADAPKPTPVPILKQINRHNEDGSYTYGYEGADGSFKIETKLPTGEVMGKYGYVDDIGKVRVVEYGANKYGFQPAGEGITVAPPTLVDESTKRGPDGQVILNDGQYYDDEEPAPARAPAPRPVARPAPRPAPRPVPRPAPQPQYEEEPTQFGAPQDSFQSSFSFSGGPAPSSFAPASRPRQPSSQGPVPPRAAISGAVPLSGPPPSFSQPRPQPIPQRPQPQAPPQQFFSPAPVYESRPSGAAPPPPPPQQRQNFARQASSGSILDQLQRDYALPQNTGAPLHDISFGSF